MFHVSHNLPCITLLLLFLFLLFFFTFSTTVSIIPALSTRLGADLSGRHDTTLQLQKTQETHQSPQVSGNTTGVSSQVRATVASSQVSATGSSSQINGRTSGVEDDNRFKG